MGTISSIRKHMSKGMDEDIDAVVDDVRKGTFGYDDAAVPPDDGDKLKEMRDENHRLGVAAAAANRRNKEYGHDIELLRAENLKMTRAVRDFVKLAVYPEQLALMDDAVSGNDEDENLYHLLNQLLAIIRNTYTDFADKIKKMETGSEERSVDKELLATLNSQLVIKQEYQDKPRHYAFGDGKQEGPGKKNIPGNAGKDDVGRKAKEGGGGREQQGGERAKKKSNTMKTIERWLKEKKYKYSTDGPFDYVVQRQGKTLYVLVFGDVDQLPKREVLHKKLDACFKTGNLSWRVVVPNGKEQDTYSAVFDKWLDGAHGISAKIMNLDEFKQDHTKRVYNI